MEKTKKDSLNHFAGALLGGALGDALGLPVHTLSNREIIQEYGQDGITELKLGKDGLARITNDTQLTLFTAEGLIRDACRRAKKEGERDLRETTPLIYRAYLRWLYTQGLSTSNWGKADYDGWLVNTKALYTDSDFSTTSVTTLGSGVMGTFVKPINTSTTCGAVVRVAPVGLFAETAAEAFELGNWVGAITHGSPLAYYSSGAMSLLIYNITQGMSIMEASLDVLEELNKHEGAKACAQKIEEAIELYQTKFPSMQALTKLINGREAVATLAIGIYCALTYQDDLIKAIILAANHGGNSHSTAAVTGNIVGTYLGRDAIPQDWIEKLRLRKEIEIIAEDLHTRYSPSQEWAVKYPSW